MQSREHFHNLLDCCMIWTRDQPGQKPGLLGWQSGHGSSGRTGKPIKKLYEKITLYKKKYSIKKY